MALWYRYSVTGEQLLSLVFVEMHSHTFYRKGCILLKSWGPSKALVKLDAVILGMNFDVWHTRTDLFTGYRTGCMDIDPPGERIRHEEKTGSANGRYGPLRTLRHVRTT